jgi:hypothetical protein
MTARHASGIRSVLAVVWSQTRWTDKEIFYYTLKCAKRKFEDFFVNVASAGPSKGARVPPQSRAGLFPPSRAHR